MPSSSISQLTVDDDVTVVQGPQHTGPSRNGDEPEEEAPRFLGRYMILDELGVGGMGRVFRAYDPQLDREVALKLLRRVTRDARARLRREAQAMAQLSHANVLPIYDVADDGRRVFMAMELVRGQSVREWLDDDARSWERVLEVFAAAGEGLAAAHDAGLVHRDFKPGNVLLGNDGRVRVMDFGLARGTSEGAEGSLVGRSSDSWSRGSDESHSSLSPEGLASAQGLRGTDSQDVLSSLADDLTQMGTVVGTPAYMAPEQHLGHTADPRCDQYGFCVALWEALYGRRPFDARKVADWYHAKTTMTPRIDPRREVPRWLHAVVLRGLAPRPADRFGSMRELLRVLSRGTRRRRYRRSGMLALGAVVLLGGIGAALYDDQALCTGAGDKLVGIWDLETATEVEQAVLASEVSYAPDTWARLVPLLEDYSTRWQAAHEDACHATHVRDEQSEELMDARMRCLEDRRRGLRALVHTLRAADAQVVERAVSAANALAPIEPCANVDYVMAQALPPSDPALAAEVEEVEDELAHIKALTDAGQAKQAQPTAKASLQRAETLGHAPLLAWAHQRQGQVDNALGHYEQSEEHFERAYFIAQREGLESLQAAAAIVLVHVVGSDLGRLEDGEQWGRFAQALVDRLHDPSVEAGYLNNVGMLANLRGDNESASAQIERSLVLREQALGTEHPLVATALNNLAVVHDTMGHIDEALAMHERALAIREQALGPEHPLTGSSLMNLASMYQVKADYERGEQLLLRSQAIYERAYGRQHPMVASTLINLGNTYERLGRPERALECYAEALPTIEQAQGPLHTNVIGTHVNMANTYRTLGKREQALEHYEKALELLDKTEGNEFVLAVTLLNMSSMALDAEDLELAQQRAERARALAKATIGDEHPLSAAINHNLGQVFAAKGEHAEAVPLLREALTVRRKLLGAQHPDTGDSLARLGIALIEAGQPEQALEPLQDAIEIFASGAGGDPEDMATSEQQVRFELARARWALDLDRSEARASAQQAHDALKKRLADDAEELQPIEQWLAEHPGPKHRG